MTPTQWLVCAIAAIGFAFDIYEILMLPLIVRPALLELTGAAPGSPEFQLWVGRLFYIPAFAGGIFGLLGGYLTDLFGRRRVLTFSILIYAVAAFLSGFSTSVEMLLVLRCFVFVGVCVEFVAAVAWLAELLPGPEAAREGAGLHAGVLVARRHPGGDGERPRASRTRRASRARRVRARHRRSACAVALHADVGRDPGDSADSDPAVPAGVARLGRRRRRPARSSGRASRRSSRPTCGARRSSRRSCSRWPTAPRSARSSRFRRSFPACPKSREAVAGPAAAARPRAGRRRLPPSVTKIQEIGGLVGRVILAYLAVVIVSRRKLIRLFQIPGLIVMPRDLRAHRDVEPDLALSGDLPGGLADRRAVQLLGQLSAAGLSRSTCAAPARALPPTSAAG